MSAAAAKRAGQYVPPVVLLEAQIEKTCSDFLAADGWRALKMEQQWSEKKHKATGENAMADHLYIRYWAGSINRRPQSHDQRVNASHLASGNEVLWIEWKRIDKRGRTTKATFNQNQWHEAERARGALTLIAGVDFPATIEGFQEWYRNSGLARGRKLRY